MPKEAVMAMMPGATNRLLANQARQGRMKSYDVACLHTMVGSLAGTDGMFQQGGTAGTESHFGVGGDGTIYQWVDTKYTADANYLGSGHVISIETADHGPEFASWNTSGDNVPAWTSAQIRAIVKILVWVNKTHGIPLRTTTSVTQKGVGYHRQGVPGNGLPSHLMGTKYQWSKYRGKVCPGDRRIAQIPGIVKQAQAGTTATTEPKGILGMSKRVSHVRTKVQPVKGDWTARHLPIDDKGNYSILTGPAVFDIGFKVDIKGLGPGEYAYVILAEAMYKKGQPTVISRELATAKVTSSGVVSLAAAFTLYKTYKGKSPRLRIAVKTRAKKVTAENLIISGIRD